MDISAQFLILVPVVLGLVEVAKKSGFPTRWAPLLSLLIGVGGAFLLSPISTDTVLQGLIAGLSACGLWSGTKTTTGN